MNEILKAVIMLVIGFVLLIKGADFFVDGSASVARRFRVPPIIIGLTIVAMGTSLPECAVSISASITNNNTLAVSNVTGSNIFNLMMVCGVCALFRPLPVEIGTLKKEFPFSIACAALLLGLGYWGMSLDRVDGIIFCVIFILFLLWMVRSAIKARKEMPGVEHEGEEAAFILPMWQCALCIVGGAIAIAVGGDWVVDSAVTIATAFNISQTIIGLTIVALGTSLPELVTGIVAARKGEVDMAMGNVIGSNIFNILFVLGAASVVSPIPFLMENVYDIIILLVVSLLVWVYGWTKKEITRMEGLSMVIVYIAYTVYICIR
ncbi:MAG: calcium/sodium antiporter [Lachnospiraceae bacterium]|nr:calcium/sodium antiporter [Lachnospiraceae bacterium]